MRHKDKAHDKHEQRVNAAVGASGSPSKGGLTKEEKKEKAKKKVVKDANGNELKRPLSAYMLYNNHRRPTLRTEHPGKSSCQAYGPTNLKPNFLAVQSCPFPTSPS